MATFTVSGTDTTVKFEYTALTTLIQSIVGSASEYLFEHGYGNHGTEEAPKVFADLTSQDKLDLVGEHLQQVIVDLANTQKSTKAQETARIAEEESKYEL